jgi:hypothetical protein
MGAHHTDIVKARHGEVGLRYGQILVIAPVANDGLLPVYLSGSIGKGIPQVG